MENNQPEKEINIGVFIDFQNIAHGSNTHAQKEDVLKKIKHSLLYLKNRGRLLVKTAYADWTGQFSYYRKYLRELSIDLTELPSSTSGKNSADIKLVVDAIEVAITKSYIDTIVVISGDSDYAPLISKLREFNKYVIVIGDRKNTSDIIVGYCDLLRYFDELRPTETIDLSKLDKNDILYAYELLKESVKYISARRKTYSTSLKPQMIKLDAAFNEKNYKINRWSDFLKKAKEDGIIYFEDNKDDPNNPLIKLC
ncbi:MAG: hypothetical protein POELPBGB_00237 [Bacteroidia bacterium]|nr:hypothetical protein [Bacteroidia bacterium]